LLGHGGCAFDLPLDADVGFGVGLAVGFGVGSLLGFAVGAAVGFAVGLAVGAAVGSPVAAGWLGRGVDGAKGAPVGLPGTPGEAEAIAELGLGIVPDAVGDGEGAGADPDGVADGVSLTGGC